MHASKELAAPHDLVCEVARTGKLPVPNFAAGGVATPADAALMMALGAEAVFVGSGIFKSSDPPRMAAAIVRAVTHWNDPQELARIAELGDASPMRGLELAQIPEESLLQTRGD
jgi:pyridoxal 5'-phosphate synthase pdxS subunit